MNSIHFYRRKEDHGFLSNFARYPISIDDKVWPTSEHYYQAQKFHGTQYEENIRLMERPMDAANAGRDRTLPLRSDWETVKNDVMRAALNAKFTQHTELMAKLLATGNAELVEHTENDSYWGDGGNGSGKNMLGKLLMELRERLSKKSTIYVLGHELRVVGIVDTRIFLSCNPHCCTEPGHIEIQMSLSEYRIVHAQQKSE